MELIQKTTTLRATENLWIWKLKISPKIKHFLWKLNNDGLPTKERLRQNHIGITGGCILCQNNFEDTTHLLFQCPITKEVLKKLCPKAEYVIMQKKP